MTGIHRGILFRSIVVTLAAFVVAAIGAITYTTYATAERASRHMDTRLVQLLDTVQSTVKIACFLNDEDLAKEVARGLLSNSEVLRVTISTSDRTLADLIRTDTTPVVATDVLPVIERSVVSPFSRSETVGSIVLTPNPAVIAEMKNQDIRLAAQQMTALLAFAALVITVALIFFVVRPISLISLALHRMDPLAGDRLDVPRGHVQTEIGRLVRDINELADHLVVAFKDAGEARDAAEAASTAKSAFLANMSHEIRTPISAVLGLARIGARKTADDSAQTTFHQISDAGTHLLEVINDVLDISKIEAGKLDIDLHEMNLGDLVSEVTRLVAPRASEKQLVLESRMADGLPDWIKGDSTRIRQILLNLLSNAIKFTAQGKVEFITERAGDTLAFRVADQGVGLSPEAISRLFQPFEQADNSTTRKYGGTGLGLAISMQLARLMGGRIDVVSELNVGSRFTLILPLTAVAAPAELAPPPPAESGNHLAGLRVLAAEDIEVNRLILEDLLREGGACFVFATNGQEAVAQVTANPDAFDVVLMDVQMPVMDGYEATRRIAAIRPQLPVIGLTAHALAEERAKCLAAGMVDHVTKPVVPAALIASILRFTGRQAVPSIASAVPSALQYSVPPAPTFEVLGASEDDEIDWGQLAERFQGKEKLTRKLAQTMIATHGDSAAKFRDAIAAEDFERLVFLAHGLKGTAGNLAANSIHALAEQVVTAARQGDHQAFRLTDTLIIKLERMLDQLSRYIADTTPA